METYRQLAEYLVISGYATHFKPVTYGLTKSTTYEVYVNDRGWELVNPFGHGIHSEEQAVAITIESRLRGRLISLLRYLTEDELLHFNKIHQRIKEMSEDKLNNAIQLVERTLEHNNIEYG